MLHFRLKNESFILKGKLEIKIRNAQVLQKVCYVPFTKLNIYYKNEFIKREKKSEKRIKKINLKFNKNDKDKKFPLVTVDVAVVEGFA